MELKDYGEKCLRCKCRTCKKAYENNDICSRWCVEYCVEPCTFVSDERKECYEPLEKLEGVKDE